MHSLQIMIDELSRRASESDLIALLATSRHARLYNTALARELRDVVTSLQNELDRRRTISPAQGSPGWLEPPTSRSN
jgi:hypothetical protein